MKWGYFFLSLSIVLLLAGAVLWSYRARPTPFVWQDNASPIASYQQQPSIMAPPELQSLGPIHYAHFNDDATELWLQARHDIVVVNLASQDITVVSHDYPQRLAQYQKAFKGRYHFYATIGAASLEDTQKEQRYHFEDDALGVFSPAAFAAEQQLLATGTKKGDILLWDIANKGNHTRIRAHKGQECDALEFSPDGNVLVSLGSEGALVAWDVTQRQKIAQTHAPSQSMVRDVQLSRHGRFVLLQDANSILVWDVQENTRIIDAPKSSLTHYEAALHPYAPVLALSQRQYDALEHKVELDFWHLPQHNVYQHGILADMDVNKVIFSADGRTLAVIDNAYNTHLWQAQ